MVHNAQVTCLMIKLKLSVLVEEDNKGPGIVKFECWAKQEKTPPTSSGHHPYLFRCGTSQSRR